MITFICAIILLLCGYWLYGRLVETVFRPDSRPTPAVAHPDGVDFVPMKTWRVFLIQLLNIAGTGPIFGALMGAVFGPVVFLWIVFGSILGGAVHDYMSGMISVRMNGASISEIVGKYLGGAAKQIMRVFSVILLVLVGAVFTTSPAALIARLTPAWMNTQFWVAVILVYYLLATLLPIDKLIGKLYPIFGGVLIIMVVGIIGGLVAGGYTLPELVIADLHPDGLPVWPFMFVTVACGAVSGFHATQSPMMARCMKTEKDGRRVFYGAMIAESVIALIWAAIAMAFFSGADGLAAALAEHGNNAAWVVNTVSTTTLGVVGGILAVLGVVAAPVTSGDTAFRSARLIIADVFHIEQRSIARRLMISVPLFAVGVAITFVDFDVVWRYFAWTNQALATVVLWTIAAYLYQRRANMWVVMPVAVFMTFICSSFVFVSGQFFGMENRPLAYGLAVVVTAALTVAMNYKFRRDGKFLG